MKLLSYHIENYGKIHGVDGDFAEGLTCFYQKNGFGKSTLASFLKAMFYGLPSYTVATKTFQERQRYYPFSGGKFGGSLTFELGGKNYRIERFFDKKSAKGDECRVFENGALYDGFGEDVGRAIFGVDEESFKKTVFITADEMEISSTRSINEKLNGGAGNGDENALERALDALEKAKKNLKAARGGGGKINEKKTEIVELTARIKNLKDMSESLSAEYVERERCVLQIGALDEQVKRAAAENLVLEKWETYDRMTAQMQAKEQSLKSVEAAYPLGIPSESERVQLERQWQTNNQLLGSLQTHTFSSQNQEKLDTLQEKFKNGVPMSLTMEEMQDKISRISALKAEAERLRTQPVFEQEKTFEAKSSQAPKAERNKKNVPLYLSIVLSALLLCAGAILVALLPVVGIGLLAVGAVLLGGSVLFFTRKKERAPLQEEEREYQELLAASKKNETLLLELEKQAEDLACEVDGFLSSYGSANDKLQVGLNQLTADILSYRALAADREQQTAWETQIRAQLQEGEGVILSILQKYELAPSMGTMDGLKRLEMSAKTRDSLIREREALAREISAYRERNQLVERPQSAAQNVDELHTRLSALRRGLADCDKRIAETERLVSELPDVENALALAQEKLEEYKDKYELIVDTMSALTNAEQTLKDKYVAPIKDRFSAYAEALEEVLNEKVRMNKDYQIVFERGGELRSDKHLSAGERSLCALCLRLALLDNMYEREQPFIIMDDPFVHLDEEHMARTKALLRLLAKNRQILYFCCHESRRA